MKQGYTHIVYLLDSSGSMASTATDVVGGFNSFIEDQKKVPGEATISLYQFDTKVRTDYSFLPLKQANSLLFVPNGMTALYDAIGIAISETGTLLHLMYEDDRPEKVLFIIMTDGQENSSIEYTHSRVMELIKSQTKNYSWEFVFAGANQDALKTGAGLGIKGSSSLTYAANSVGTKQLYASLSAQTMAYRTDVSASFSFSDKDRSTQASAGA